jgi:sterol desaturase/sphingolipid hydroxylase (fatty acid hydroxylase superfamily)
MNAHAERTLSLPSPRLLTWLVFPAALAAVAAASLALLGRAPPPLVTGAVLLGSVLLILALERLFPLHRSWNRSPEGLDLALLLGNRLVDVLVLSGSLALMARLPAASWRLWPVGWPLLAQAALGAVLAEGLRYALHRLSHRPGFWWRVHRVHHQPRRMYALNGPRLHPLNQLWIALCNVTPMLLLGATLPAVSLAANLTVFFVVFQHANLRLRFDGWNRWLATPDVHRLHHARGARRDVNFGIVLLLFDRLFGTYQEPRDVPAGGIGLDEDGSP